MEILEIGPSYNPVAAKAKGWNCFSIDHDDQANLRLKYKDQPVDTSRIEAVDFIWREGPLDEVIPPEHLGTFDACIASHVIEHFPNPVQVLRSLQRILKPEGLLSLAVPGKRFCFDYFKPLSLTGDLLQADFSQRTRHTRRTTFNHVAYSVLAGAAPSWGQHDVGTFRLAHSLAEARRQFDAFNDSPSAPYADHHAWHYTPSSFRLVMLELNVMDVVDWREDTFFSTAGCEFFVTLKRGKASFASAEEMEAERLRFLEAMMHDVFEQCVFSGGLAAAEPAISIAAPGSNIAHALISIQVRQVEMMRRLERQGKYIGKIWDVARSYKKLVLPFRAARRAAFFWYDQRAVIGDYFSAGLKKARIMPRWLKRSVLPAGDDAEARRPGASGRAGDGFR